MIHHLAGSLKACSSWTARLHSSSHLPHRRAKFKADNSKGRRIPTQYRISSFRGHRFCCRDGRDASSGGTLSRYDCRDMELNGLPLFQVHRRHTECWILAKGKDSRAWLTMIRGLEDDIAIWCKMRPKNLA
jgi:hypothetical protein